MTRIFFVLLGLGPIVAAIMMHGALAAFIDVPSLLIVFVPALAFTCAAHGLGGLMTSLAVGMGDDPGASAEADRHRTTLQTLRNTLCCAAAVGTLIGLVLMLRNMSDPSSIGPAMAVALLSGLYGIGCAELLVAPMVHRFNYAQSNPPQATNEGARSAVIALSVVLANLVSFFVMFSSLMTTPA